MLQLAQVLGNQVLGRLVQSRLLQAKLNVSQPGDPLELEADRVAGEIVSTSAAPVRPFQELKPSELSHPDRSLADGVGTIRETLRSPGQPLEPEIRVPMEERFGRDFGAVRIHTGPVPAAAAGAIGAKAFTVGGEIVLGHSRSAQRGGQELLAHELTHVVQQGGARKVGAPSTHKASLLPPAISEATGTPTVSRKTEDSSASKTQDSSTSKTEEALDYAKLAQQIYTAIKGLGTDEEAVYSALRQLGRDKTKISALEAKYLATYGEPLEEAIRGDFSGQELDDALVFISSSEEELAARRLRTAVEGLGTDEDAIYEVLKPFNHDQSRISQIKVAYQQRYSEDLVARLHDEMSGGELSLALHLLGPPSPLKESVVRRAEEIRGTSMTWTSSVPGKSEALKTSPKAGSVPSAFEEWASAPSEGKAPKVDPSTTINCWEMILLVAYQKGLRWQWIHDLYTNHPDWTGYFVEKMSRGYQFDYEPNAPLPKIPARGDIVFFNGPAHVALATGERVDAGVKVLSFWPPPKLTGRFSEGTLAEVQLTTIEELVPFLNNPKVTFATPPW